MHTYWVRLNAVFFYGLNVLLGLSCCAWVSCLQQDLDFHSDLPRPVVDTVRVNELLSLRAHGGVDREKNPPARRCTRPPPAPMPAPRSSHLTHQNLHPRDVSCHV